MINAITIDLEEWFHPFLVKNKIAETDKKLLIESELRWFLAELKIRNIKSTFFILGELIIPYQRLIQEIYSEGHEIACHSYSHKPLWEIGYSEFTKEIKRFKSDLNQIIRNVQIFGFRAPTFSINKKTKWALEILSEEGFLYDSSIFPVKNHIYGDSNAPLTIHSIHELPQKYFYEVPLSAAKIGPVRIPVAGGFYFRLLPWKIQYNLLKKIEKARPLILYIHPWELLNDNLPKVHAGFVNNFITYYGLNSVKNKIINLLDSFKFSTIYNILLNHKNNV